MNDFIVSKDYYRTTDKQVFFQTRFFVVLCVNHGKKASSVKLLSIYMSVPKLRLR